MARDLDAYAHYAHEDDFPGLDADGAVLRLSLAIRCRTISPGSTGFDGHEFELLHRLLCTGFPQVMSHGSFEELGRSVLVTIPGADPSLEPVLLIAHQDVVPVAPGTEGDWTHDAFSGHVDDKHVWGRGTLDIKGMLMAELEACELLLSCHGRPRRGICLAFGDDEETQSSGAAGLAALLERRGMRFCMVLDEGTTTLSPGSVWGAPDIAVQHLCLSQKGFMNVRLSAHGEGGHSSNPFGGTSIERLCRAVTRLSACPMRPRLVHVVADAFRAVAPFVTEGPFTPLLEDVDGNADAIAALAAGERDLFPLVSTTFAADVISGGTAANVLPTDATAVVNVRLLPGDEPDVVLSHMRRTIDDDQVCLEVLHHTPAGRVDRPCGEAYEALVESLERHYQDVAFLPSLMTGGADGIRYQGVSDLVCRVLPYCPTPEEESQGLHGTDERISIRTYLQGIRTVAWFVERLAF